DVVPARSRRRGRALRRRRRRARSGARSRGRGRLAVGLPPLRARLRARHPGEHRGETMARRRRARVPLELPPRRRAGRRGSRARTLARLRRRRGDARRAPWLVRSILRRARLAIAPSAFLADSARALGARTVRIVPLGVEIPPFVREPEAPPHVLYVGRLAREKGVEELVAAADGLPLRVVGEGPLPVPSAGFVPRDELGGWFERAAVVAAPSRREGYGVTAREAMAWGRPVVATAVGGLRDAVEDGVTGLLVPPRDVGALRAALERLLDDAELRGRLGAAARAKAERELSFGAAADALVAAYTEALA